MFVDNFIFQDDYNVTLANGIITKEMNVVCPVDASGCFTEEVPDFKGMHVKVSTDQTEWNKRHLCVCMVVGEKKGVIVLCESLWVYCICFCFYFIWWSNQLCYWRIVDPVFTVWLFVSLCVAVNLLVSCPSGFNEFKF